MSWNRTPPVIREDEDETALKLEFAKRWARAPNQYLSIGYAMFTAPGDEGRAMQAQAWRHDPFVIAEYERLREIPETEGASDKERFLTKLATFSSEVSDPKVKLDALKLEAEVLGLTGKGAQVNVNVDASTTKNVLFVPQSEGIDDFRERFRQQQTALIASARTVKNAPATVN